MQFIKADTSVKVIIGPFVDVGDGFTPETGVTLTGGGDNADEAEVLKHDNATTVDVSSNTWAAITGVDGYYHLTLTSGNTDTEGHLSVIIQNDSVHLPVRNDFMVVAANVYDSLFAASGTDVLDVNVTQWLGTAAATPTVAGVPEVDLTHVAGATTNVSALATNVDAILTDTGTTLDNHLTDIKGTGFVKDTHSLVDIEAYVDLIDDGTSGLAKIATDAAAILVDTETTIPGVLGTPIDFGSGTSTLAANLQDIADNGTATFDRSTDSLQAIRDRGDSAWTTGSGTGLTPLASGTAQGGTSTTIQLAAGETFANDELNSNICKITSGTGAGQARGITDYVGATDTATVSPAWTTTPDATSIYEIVEGPAYAVWDEVLSGATHNIANSAGRRLRNIQDFGIYDMASVWVDEVGGTSTGTTDGEDATVSNRANDFDNAQTVAASVGLDNIHVQNGNTITLTATLNGYNVWSGSANEPGSWTLALGGQDIGSSTFSGAVVSGTGTGTTPKFRNCVINTATLPPCTAHLCGFGTTVTMGSAGAYRFHHCFSNVAGAGSPTIDMGAAVGATTFELRDWRGGITLSNLAAGDVVTLDGTFGTITLNGADATVEIRGTYKALTNNLTGSPSVNTDGAVKGADVAAILVDTAEIGAAGAGLTNINLPNQTMDITGNITGNLSGSVGSVTGSVGSVAGNVDGNVAGSVGSVTAATTGVGTISGAAVTGTLTTAVMTSDVTGYLDDELIGRVIVFTGGTANGQATDITDYAATNGTFTYTAITTAPVDGDTFVVV